MEDIRASIVEVKGTKWAGTGFLVTQNGLIATSSHLFWSTLTSEPIRVTFYPSGGKQQGVAYLVPELFGSGVEERAVFLRVKDLPEGVRPLPLAASQQTRQHVFHTFGFPTVSRLDGIPVSGTIVGETSDPSTEQRLLALKAREISQGFSGAPVWDEKRQAVVGMVVSTIQEGPLQELSFAIPSERLKAVCNDLWLQDFCPYRGLQPYREEDAHVFFGREQYVEEVLALHSRDQRIVAILGPVGSGKTSVIRAGLLPRLRQRTARGTANSSLVVCLTVTETLLQDLQAREPFADSTAERLVDRLRLWTQRHSRSVRPILVLDQFESLFSLLPVMQQRMFVEQLTELIESDLCTVIIAMRDDYYSHLAEHSSLMRYVERQLSNIPRMRYEELLSVVEGPAQAVDLGLQEGLAVTIAQDAMRSSVEPNQARGYRHSSVLPLVSLCLEELWERRSDGQLTLTAFFELGGISSVLQREATLTYERLDSQERDLARRILLDLVEIGSDPEGRLDCRRSRTLSALCRGEEEREAVHKVVEFLAEGHLLEMWPGPIAGETTVQLIHETLLREWNLLQDWLHEDRDFYRWLQEMASRAERWFASQEDPEQRDQGLLLRGRDLFIAEDWLTCRPRDISHLIHTFITASYEQHRREEQEAQLLERLKQQQPLTQARYLAAQALCMQEQRPQDIELSLLLAVEAMKRYPCLEADQALRRGLALLPHFVTCVRTGAASQAVTFSADGFDLAVACATGVILHRSFRTKSESTCFLKDVGIVQALTFSSDGAYLLALDDKGSVWVIDVVRRKPLLSLCQGNKIHAIAMAPCGRYLALTAGDDGEVNVWDIPQGKPVWGLRQAGPVRGLAVSQDGAYCVTACDDRTARVWEMASGKQLALFAHDGPVHSALFSPDGTSIATASGETVRLWHWLQVVPKLRRWRPPQPFLEIRHNGYVHSLAFSPDSALVVTASADRTVRIWAIDEAREIRHFSHDGPVRTVAFDAKGQFLATGSDDQTARIWIQRDWSREKAVHYLPAPGGVRALAWHPSNPYIAVASEDQCVRIWEMGRSSQIKRFHHTGEVRQLIFCSQREQHHLQAILEEERRLLVWDILAGDAPSILTCEAVDDLTALTFSSDGSYLAAACRDGTVEIWDCVHACLRTRLHLDLPATILTFCPESSYLATVCGEAVYLWKWQQSPAALLHLPHDSPVQRLVFAPDGTLLITVTDDCHVFAWRWQVQRREWLSHHDYEGTMRSLAIEPSGRYLLTVSEDVCTRLWEVNSGRLVAYMAHAGAVRAAVFSHDGRWIATASDDQTVGIWETDTGQQRACLEHESCVSHVAFAPDDRYLATSSDGQTIQIWLWKPEDMIAEATRHLTRNLTLEEWRTFLREEPYRKTCALQWRESDQVFNDADQSSTRVRSQRRGSARSHLPATRPLRRQ